MPTFTFARLLRQTAANWRAMASSFWASSQCDLLLAERERREEREKSSIRASTTQEIVLGPSRDAESRGAARETKGERDYQNKVNDLVDYAVTVGKELKIKERPILTASVYLRRIGRDLLESCASGLDRQACLSALSCVYLACKVEEVPISVDKLVAFSKGSHTHQDVLKEEVRSLRALNASLIVHHPHNDAKKYASAMGLDKDVLHLLWLVVRDTYKTDLCLTLPPHIIALGCIYTACAFHGTNALPWCKQNKVEEAEVVQVCAKLVRYYKRNNAGTNLT